MIPSYRPAQPGDRAWDPRLREVDWTGYTWDDKCSPVFTPDYEPRQLGRMGVFGDAYWGGPAGTERREILPYGDLVTGPHHYLNHRGRQAASLNHHRAAASLSKAWWLDRGLIFTPDPLGWYEWFHWYWLGRRIPAYDTHQINRWLGFRTRQLRMYWARPSAGTAQALLHWGIRADPHA